MDDEPDSLPFDDEDAAEDGEVSLIDEGEDKPLDESEDAAEEVSLIDEGEEMPEDWGDTPEDMMPEAPFPEDELLPAEPETPPAPQEPVPPKAQKPAAEDALSKDKIVGLMNYLKDLAGGLPDLKRENFMKSDARLSMEYVINTLEGKKGLLKEIKEKIPEAKAPTLRPNATKPGGRAGGTSGVNNQKVAGTLSYLENLSSDIPDKNLFAALKQKVHSIMSRIKAVTDKRKNQ